MWDVKTTLDPASPEKHAHGADSAPKSEEMPKHGIALDLPAFTPRTNIHCHKKVIPSATYGTTITVKIVI